MDELIKAMSVEELGKLKETYQDNASIVAVLDGYIESKVKEAEAAKIATQFTGGITKLFSKLAHPESVHNVYARWAEVDVLDGEPEEVEVVDSDGNKEIETRQASHKEFQWVVQVNHAVRVENTTTATQTASKRAITVYKREGLNLIEKGRYASASKACELLGLTIGGDSANRVLARDSYIVEPYAGTEFTS